MNRPVTRTLGALVLAAAVATSSTPTFAASHTSSPVLNLTKKRVKTFAGLSQALRTTALEKLRSIPNAIKAPGQGGTQQSQQDIDRETDLTCGGEWFITWDEDANGDPIIGTYQFHCGDSSWGIG
jgi:hypothetical protein